jgi:hypothetical protein
MASTNVGPVQRPAGGQAVRFWLGVVVPLSVVVVAYGLWWISDRLLYIGPLDRATFGWVVVVPVWASAPIAAAFAWRGLSEGRTAGAALVVGCATAAAAALLFWLAGAHPDCQFGATRLASDWILPSLIVGAVIGAGPPVSGLMAVALLRNGHPWRAALLGFAAELALVFVAIIVAGTVLMGSISNCNRPI